MIPKTQASNHLALAENPPSPPLWVTELRQAIRDPLELCREVGLDPQTLDTPAEGLQAGHQLFQTLVPRPFIQRMQKGDPKDPLLLQVLPQSRETQHWPGFTQDPLEEASANPLPGLIHKYSSRVLLTLAGSCAVNCRYCFRRHFPYAENSLGQEALDRILDYLNRDSRINEVILSGGDPLATSDKRLASVVKKLESIPHLKRLRIHTRLPVVLPSRVDTRLLDWLSSGRLDKVMVIHINHPNEIDTSLEAALADLRGIGVTLFNQSVLLRGVNDDPEILAELSEKLFSLKVLPYYLHAFDPVEGAAHFALEDTAAQQLYQQLLARLPGYLVPRLVREFPDRPSKTPLGWSF
ncbi:EF-P beta-lysylation protein EpmB [Marinospirillum perlucidum]|uniref:EF-P beta-lysylation protein EpmB n=1 Tax=Marinospirillum perlucidum TaxID=1982602 RepID=UPI000DF3B78D|nr:EF-P beta-lysylation protein EpmB [Marinospirillum perlucidum]